MRSCIFSDEMIHGKKYSCRPGQAKREPGPITTGRRVAKARATSRRNDSSLWLWVPAFAGTTKSKQTPLPVVGRGHLARRGALRGPQCGFRFALLVGDRQDQLRVVIVGMIHPRRHFVPGELA